ncbi:M48 family metallopeptidase [Neisseria sp. CCUG12390]|uniref:M48 family metallopeptidase n=1 Tax=Neisseria sp. CCUG12390 TaxID=3392035 RepID=UPI003A0FEB80
MSGKITVRYYDGRLNTARMAELYAVSDGIRVVFDGGAAEYARKDLAYMAGVGGVLPAIDLPDDARIEFLSHDVPDWLRLKNQTMLKQVNRFEKSWKWVAVGLVVVVAVVFGVYRWGIPAASYHLAHRLPADTLHSLGGQAEEMITKITEPSKLSAKRRQQITDLYRQQLKPETPAKLLFRKGGDMGANAFAIPNNTIVLTDELVALAENDHEILGVLAHEQGHLVHRHSLQQALRGIGIGVLMIAVTGDSSDLLTTLPVLLAGAQYSQAFEMEADRYAVGELQRLNLPPQHFSAFLERLQAQSDHEEGGIGGWLSTHPMTAERVKQVEDLQKTAR